ncbi:MAG: 2Fe-2S iron-sulfur cluster-binding protein [Acetobacterales bacterium]
MSRVEMRVEGGVIRPDPVDIEVDGATVTAVEGEMLAAALLAAGVLHLRDSPRAGTPRGAFCFMGVCQECLVEADGRLVQSCLEPVRAGMHVTRYGRRP